MSKANTDTAHRIELLLASVGATESKSKDRQTGKRWTRLLVVAGTTTTAVEKMESGSLWSVVR